MLLSKSSKALSALRVNSPTTLRAPLIHLSRRSIHISRPSLAENTDRLKGPVEQPGVMQAVKNTIAENLSGVLGNTASLVPEDSQFSLEQVPDLTGKVAIVTGGTEGIGYGCTHTLLSHNVSKLFIISPGKEIATEAINAISEEMGKDKADRVVWIECDLSDWEQTAKVSMDIAKQTDRIDILINNAARGIMTRQLNKYGVDLHLSINHIGHVVFTSHLLPTIKATAKKGNTVRLVQFGSNIHEQTPKETEYRDLEELNRDYGPQQQYGRAKLTSLLYARYLDRHLHSKYPNILSNAVHPGIVETRQSTEHIHEAFPLLGYGMSVAAQPFKKTQFEGAVSAMYAATKTEKSGQYICPPAIVEPGSDKANDEQMGERLMDLTWKIVKEKTQAASADKGCPFKEY